MLNEKKLEDEIAAIISDKMQQLGRDDLYRQPIVSFSAAQDKRYNRLKTIIGDWHLNPTELLPEAESVISYFVPFTKGVTQSPEEANDGAYLWAEAYEVVNEYFSVINEAVAEHLMRQCYPTKSIIVTYDQKVLKAIWSHRSAAVISGLGTFGANGLVITDKGSSGRFGSIITSAKLRPNVNRVSDKCNYKKDGSCGLCFKICPVNALFPDRFEKFICKDKLLKNDKSLKETNDFQHVDTCGKCISICPFAYRV